MCTVSFIGDTYKRHFEEPPYRRYPWVVGGGVEVSRQDFEELKAKVDEMIAMLKAAKAYDELMGQAGCQMDDKIAFLKKVAALVGIDGGWWDKNVMPPPAEKAA